MIRRFQDSRIRDSSGTLPPVPPDDETRLRELSDVETRLSSEDSRSSDSSEKRQADQLVLRLALLLRLNRSRALPARDAARRTLSDHRTAWTWRLRRGLPCRRSEAGQAVALKFLPADVDRDPARLTQLHTEVRMARQVSHPNVCRVYDIDEVEGHTFISMEYVDGEDLASLLRRIGRFPQDRALAISRQVCAGLAAAHDCGVVHRDLKPANVMLDATGKVRIADFGLAGLAGESVRAGTPAYMAPEQLAGREVTTRSDIYALGLVLYEIFTGQRALDAQNLAELIANASSRAFCRRLRSCLISNRTSTPRSCAACARSEATPGNGAVGIRIAAGRRSARGGPGRGRNPLAGNGGCRRCLGSRRLSLDRRRGGVDRHRPDRADGHVSADHADQRRPDAEDSGSAARTARSRRSRNWASTRADSRRHPDWRYRPTTRAMSRRTRPLRIDGSS